MPVRPVLVVLLALLAAGLGSSTAAQAAFPGTPGRIYINDGGTLKSLLPDGTGLRAETGSGACGCQMSADGRKLAFFHQPASGPLQLVVRDLTAGTEVVVLPRGDVGVSPAFSTSSPPEFNADGDLLAVPARRDGNASSGPQDGMYVVPVNGDPLRLLYTFASDRDVQATQRLTPQGQSFDPATGQLVTATSYGVPFSPPDATTCAGNLERFDPRTGSKAGDLTPLIAGPAARDRCVQDFVPDVTPDGRDVVFARNVREGNFDELSIMRGDSNRLVTLTFAGTSLRVSPDGTQVAYNDGQDLRLVGLSGTGDRSIYQGTGGVLRVLGWPPLPGELVRITSGPSGTVNQRSAVFEFAVVGASPPPGELQCRIDDQPDFTRCTSPVALQDLSDGLHTFRVRYAADGGATGLPDTRVWTVDTTAPAVTFDEAPSGEGNPSSARIAFRSEPGATFRCSLDGGAGFDCASPQTLAGLSDGAHTFSVAAIDAAGNTGPAATVGWSVGAPPRSASVGCAPGSEAAGFGVIRLVARAENACFADGRLDGQPAKVSRGVVSLNGITLTPGPGTQIFVSERLGDGTVRADGPLTVGFGATIPLPLPRLDLDGLLTSANLVNKTLSAAEGGVLDIAGQRTIPGLQLDFGAENGGQAKVTFRVTLPKLAFSALPGGTATEGITAEFAPVFSNDRGVVFAGRLKVPKAKLFGRVDIKDLDLAYDHATGAFDGAFGAVLGEQRPGLAEPTLTFAVSLATTASQCTLKKLGLVASNVNKHISHGVFLQRFGGGFECVAAGGRVVSRVSGLGGVSFGPRIAIGSFEAEALSIDGTGTLSIPVGLEPPEAFSFEARGTGKIVDIPLAEQSVKFTPPLQLELGGALDLTVSGYGVKMEMRGSWASPDGFNAEFAGQVNAFGVLTGAETVLSSAGNATCWGPPGARVGFGQRWFEELQVFSEACDIGPFRTAVPAVPPARPARAARAVASTVSIPAGRRVVVLGVEGAGAPPKITLEGPTGQRIVTPTGTGGVDTKRAMLVQDTARNTTFVVLYAPSGGDWDVSAPAAVGPIRLAEGRPPVSVRARVVRKGRRRVLAYAAKGLEGHRVQFVERSGDAAKVLRSTGRARGRITFTPAPALGRSRRIEAVVTRNGVPRLVSTVARFRVRPPRTPRRVSGVRLRGRVLTWRPQPGTTYELAITNPDLTTTVLAARRGRVRLDGPAGRRRVAIVAVNAVGRRGPVSRTTLRLRGS